MSKRERTCQLWGWILFLVCAVFFIVSAIRNHDTPYLIGSIVFLLACILFLIPFITREKTREPDREKSEPLQ